MSDALVLAGAVVKGAFSAGVLSVLTDPETKARTGIDVRRIVGSSSGALNGAYYAAAIRDGTEASAGQRLAQLWLDDATIRRALDFSVDDVVHGLGLSSTDKLLAVLREQIRPATGRMPIQLRIIVTNASGETIEVAGSPATTFEHIVDLADADFDTAASLERVFTAVAASSAMPGVFAPVPIEIGGRTVQGFDGGLVDDAPLGHALDGAPDITRVFVCTPFPRVRTEPPELHGLALASHIFDLLVQERLIRDLQRVADGRPDVQVVEIRPDADLPGNDFSGFVSLDLRRQYVQSGADAARRALASLAPSGD
jgi:predicted acylesterase/phospholipase RssA